MMSTFEHKNSLRIIEAQIMQKLKNNEAPPKFTGSYKKTCIFLDARNERAIKRKTWSLKWKQSMKINFS